MPLAVQDGEIHGNGSETARPKRRMKMAKFLAKETS